MNLGKPGGREAKCVRGVNYKSREPSVYHFQLRRVFIMHIQLLGLIAVLFAACHVLYRISRAALSPLRSIPGPFWARFSNIWYFNQVRLGHFEKENIRLHRKYGPVVRVSPDHYSICDPAAMKVIYASGSKFKKSAWYDGWKHPQQWTIFADRDSKRHCEF